MLDWRHLTPFLIWISLLRIEPSRQPSPEDWLFFCLYLLHSSTFFIVHLLQSEQSGYALFEDTVKTEFSQDED